MHRVVCSVRVQAVRDRVLDGTPADADRLSVRSAVRSVCADYGVLKKAVRCRGREGRSFGGVIVLIIYNPLNTIFAKNNSKYDTDFDYNDEFKNMLHYLMSNYPFSIAGRDSIKIHSINMLN